MVHALIEQYTTCNVHVDVVPVHVTIPKSLYKKKHFVVLINLYNVLQEK